MPKTKKLDIFNFFYSGAAVIILIGVIAKLLEWPSQDLLITSGLAIEALVFAVSAIKFIEVKNDTDNATEATLSKVVDGLDQIASKSIVKVGMGVSDTSIKTQNTNETSSSTGKIDNGLGSFPSLNNKYEGNEIIALSNDFSNANQTLWHLEQMDILSLSKDLFFQPKWDDLTPDEYYQLSLFFKRVFDKKLPNKETLPYLLQFPVKLPIPDSTKLVIDNIHLIDIGDIEILTKAFKLVNNNSFFENYILESKDNVCTIRPKKSGEIQVYGGENENIISHINKYYSAELIVSPIVDCLQNSVKLNEQSLIDYFIQKIDIINEEELVSLLILLENQSDDIKLKLWSKFKKIRFNFSNNDGYSYLKILLQSAISFSNTNNGVQLFNRLIEFQINDNKIIDLQDVINYNLDTIYFGTRNEYSVSLKDLFTNSELENLSFINLLIDKLVTDNVAHKSKLIQLFNLGDLESKKEVFDKLNYYLTKSNSNPIGAQLAFILLYKQYSKL